MISATGVHTAPPALRDAVLLAARLGIGIAFAAHGWQKVRLGLDAVTAGMDKAGVPFPRASAVFATAAELGGGVALALGAATVLAGVLLAMVMTGAFTFVHFGRTPFVSEGGWELVAAFGTATLLIAVVGPGRVSVDHLVGRMLTARHREVDLAGDAAEVDVRAGEPGRAGEAARRR